MASLVAVSVSYMPIYVRIIMYGLTLFIVVLQELQCHVGIIRVIGISITSPSFICLHLLVSEIAKWGVYCCFTRTTLFTTTFTLV